MSGRKPARSHAAFERLVEHVVGLGFEALGLQALRPEALHDADARDRLLDDARQVAELLLELQRDRGDAVREAGRGDVEQGQRTEGEQGEGDALRHHHDDDGDDDEQRRREERQQDHDLVDLLDVGVGTRHQLTGLRLVVEREVQLLEVGEQPLAEIGLDPVRDAERRVAPRARAERLHRADEDDQHRVHDDRLGVAGEDALVDGCRGEERDRDLRCGPHHTGRHAADDPARLASERSANEPPPGPSRLALPIHPCSSSVPCRGTVPGLGASGQATGG